MTYLINAWLDRPHPYLRILNRETGQVCVALEEDAIEELLELGELDVQSLSTFEPTRQKEQIRQLFLFCYARALRPEVKEPLWR
ncbi:hypothetical protein IQ22_02177 [Pseudomonas duriflava]|uniref:Uncharacterized protein n=1 Tax=Pseudomonas duriflava TaxID=459528 RepID=A0A562QC60_9PSED|nr:hypothetical protein [Pseudomonas duriflava]TWI54314.1 hypothetical protein IQ22_02177 [Pseudomonas duriflava]